MRAGVLLVLGLVAGCEFPRPVGTGQAEDAATTGDGRIDAATDGAETDGSIDAPPLPRCNPTAPFGAATELSELNTSTRDFNARLSVDELTLYFSRSGAIWVSTRATLADRFVTAQPITELDTGGEEKSASVTADGLTLYYNNSTNSISRATRSAPTGTWGSVQAIAGTTGAIDPYITPDGAHLYWWMGNGMQYRANPDGTGATVVPYSGIGLASNIVVAPDELTVFAIKIVANVQELWTASRTSVGQPFSNAQGVGVSTAAINAPTWVSADGCVLYLFRGANNMFRMAVAVRGS